MYFPPSKKALEVLKTVFYGPGVEVWIFQESYFLPNLKKTYDMTRTHTATKFFTLEK